jgi:cupin fold WbuC family metalloprotein
MDIEQTRLRAVSPEVIYSDGGFLAVDGSTVALLKDSALASERRRSRLCFHADQSAKQQEMLIVMHRSSYVRPHRHKGKAETLTIVEGSCDAVLFNPSGKVTDVIAMSPAAEGGSFFYRMPDGQFHTLIFKSEWLVFLETTIGPFDRAMTEVAEWAPSESDAPSGRAYLAELMRLAQ